MPRKKNKNYYFTSVHDEAIIEYCVTESRDKREKLYIKYIQPAFSEMVDKIIYTYKFTNIPNIDVLKDDCKVWLTTILSKYDSTRGSKAFSYFSVITKHWFIHQLKKNSTKMKREVAYESIVKENQHEKLIYNDDTYLREREKSEFWYHLKGEVERWTDSNLFVKDNEKKVIKAVKILLENVQDIEILNKKAVYLYLRELTGMNTKQVVSGLKNMRKKYGLFKDDWNKGKI